MKKALLAGVCFVLVGCMLVGNTFALPALDKVFADLTDVLGAALGPPEAGGAGTAVHVSLVSDEAPQQLFPGGTASRTTCVQNQGSGSVFFRLVYAIQYDADSWPKLTIAFADEGYEQTDWKDITIGSTPYRMKVFTYTGELAAGADSSAVTLTIAMDDSVTSDEISRYRDDFLQTQVLAIDAAPFKDKGYTTAEAALDLALPVESLNPF